MRRIVLLLLVLSCTQAAPAPARSGGADPRCYGAAARDPRHQPCENPRLRYAVRPRPSVAQITPNAPCERRRPDYLGLAHPCAFGADPGDAAGSLALIGDSHASHWRAALVRVVRAERWSAVSLNRSSCHLSMTAKRRSCRRWSRDVLRWLAAHPAVATVFQVQITSVHGAAARPGQSEFDAEVAGYRALWRRLPRSVRRVVVIRDTPKMVTSTPGCVMRAHAARIPPGPACARPRGAALTPDPLAAAASRVRSRRIRVIDLTSFFCDPAVCFPVIGGVLVYKDTTHLTRAYATTLGPFLQRRVEALATGWRR